MQKLLQLLPDRNSPIWNVFLYIGLACVALTMLPAKLDAEAPAWFHSAKWYFEVVGFVLGFIGAKNGNSLIKDKQ